MFEVKKISMIYDMEKEEKLYALKGFDLSLPDKGLIGIIGPSGSGKSTLMYCLSTLRKPTDGSIIYNGSELTEASNAERERLRRTDFGFVFQKHYLVPYMSAVNNVMVAGVGKEQQIREKAEKILKELGIKEREFSKKPAKLSGGQCQRIAIARAVINDPKVIFADEPTASLDHENAFNVMKILKEYSKDRLVLVVTHDKSILKDSDRIIEMWDGQINMQDGELE
ncbi:MAG: ABC transporter ATP-binding protein [Lachnospiraceae bacterium]|nr:ABC transporter ATP-binding protein [Lachnospiraceae bacterium]